MRSGKQEKSWLQISNRQLGRLTHWRHKICKVLALYKCSDAATKQKIEAAVVDYSYDAASRLISLNDSQACIISWVYDADDRLTTETNTAAVVAYEYNSAGQRTKMTAAGRVPVTYGYDVAGRLQTIAQGADVFTHTYDLLSRRTRLHRPNGVDTSYTYDVLNRPVRTLHGNPNGQAVEDWHDIIHDLETALEQI